jgi:hypothetical protein
MHMSFEIHEEVLNNIRRGLESSCGGAYMQHLDPGHKGALSRWGTKLVLCGAEHLPGGVKGCVRGV